MAVPIFNRLSSFAAYSPITTRAVCDWTVQAGDVIAITVDGEDYSLPVFRQTITWNGASAKVVYESTGAPARPIMSAVNRRIWNQKRAMHELNVTVEGFSSRIEDAEGNIASLDLTTAGLALAINESKLSFGADGLTVQGGGLRVKNKAGTDVFYADTNGNLRLKGSLEGVDGTFTNLICNGGEIDFRVSGSTKVGVGVDTIGNAGFVAFGPYEKLEYRGGVLRLLSQYGDLSLYGQTVEINSPRFPQISSSSGSANARLVFETGGYRLNLSTSLRSVKRNIRPINEPSLAAMIDETPAVTYESRIKAERGHAFYGFVAEDMEKRFPWLVEYIVRNGGYEIQGVQYDRVCAVLWADAQNTHAEMRSLRAELKEIKEKAI